MFVKVPVKGSTFFTSRTGRKLVVIFAGTTTGGLFLANYIPHTFGLERYKSLMQCYQNGKQMQVSSKLTERLNDAANILEFNPSETQLLRAFSVCGFDLFSAGSTSSKFGAVIGIPFNYEVDKIEDIKSADVCYAGRKIDWNSTSGKLLEEALVLTNDEKLFGFCKVLLQLQTPYVLMNAIFPSLTFFMVYTVGHYINLSRNLLQRPFSLRFCMYVILSLFGYGSWSFLKDFNQVSYDVDIDKKLSSISPEFMKAGLGFYQKQLAKNMALRELSNNDTYTAMGNHNYILRQKSLPLTVRRSFFEQKYEEFLKTEKN